MAKGGPRGSTRNSSRPRDCMPTAPPDTPGPEGREGGSVRRPPPLFSAFPAAAPSASRRVRGASDSRRHPVPVVRRGPHGHRSGIWPAASGPVFRAVRSATLPPDCPLHRLCRSALWAGPRPLSACQAGIVGRVAFRAFYGLGFSGHRLRLGRHLQRRLIAGDSGRTAGRSWRAIHCEIRAWSGLAGSGLVTLRLHSADRAPAPPCRAPRRAASSCP